MQEYTLKPLGSDPYNSISLVAFSRLTDGSPFTIDQMPLLAARVSTAREGKTGADPEADFKLMQFLAEHKHLSPFEHQSVTFRVVAPLFVFREWHRHRTQSYNEMSMRYTSDPVGKFYIPEVWRKQSKANKQGSSEEPFNDFQQACFNLVLNKSYKTAKECYDDLVQYGIAKELARLVVPVGNYSEMYATANLRNWHAFWKLRSDSAAQWEIRQYAYAIDTILSYVYPKSWEVLKCYG